MINLAYELKDRIREELGFTVNVGVSTNFLLSKMAGDFSKPDKVHTLFPEEIEKKMWPLPVSDLFLCGRSTVEKLHRLGTRYVHPTMDAKRLQLEQLIHFYEQIHEQAL